MKKTIFFLLSLAVLTFATDPISLVKQDACRWGASSQKDGDEKTVVIKKGCPDYFKKTCKGAKASFTKKKIDGEDVLVVNWEVKKSSADGTMKLVGETRFVVGEYDGEENLYVYEGSLNCKGPQCKAVEAQLAPLGQIFAQLGMPNAFASGVWGKKFAIDMESAMYNANHDMGEEVLTQALMSAMLGGRASPDAMNPVILNTFIAQGTNVDYCTEE